jgi:hypothetical protein
MVNLTGLGALPHPEELHPGQNKPTEEVAFASHEPPALGCPLVKTFALDGFGTIAAACPACPVGFHEVLIHDDLPPMSPIVQARQARTGFPPGLASGKPAANPTGLQRQYIPIVKGMLRG